MIWVMLFALIVGCDDNVVCEELYVVWRRARAGEKGGRLAVYARVPRLSVDDFSGSRHT